MKPWRLVGRYVVLSLLMTCCTFGLALMFLPAMWYHEWWPDIRAEFQR